MSNLIKRLEEANKKERHHLVLNILGKNKLPISDEFRTKLGREICLDIPASAYVAIDYQLNWLEQCLTGRRMPGSTVRDSDILIAFEVDHTCHLVMVEGKGPSGSWNNDQMCKKALALKTMFGEGKKGNKIRGVTAHFCLMSPNRPQDLKTNSWPEWMKNKGADDSYFWVELRMSSA